MKQQKILALNGFSLLECCITLVLISALLSILMQQYLQVKQQYEHMNIALDEALETQLAIDLMRDRIRHAGFTPCRGVSHLTVVDTRSEKNDVASWSPLANGFVCRRMDTLFSQAFAKPRSVKMRLSKSLKLALGQTIMIADCVHAEIQRIENIDIIAGDQYITIGKPLLFEYTNPFYVGLWLEEFFWIKASRHDEKSLMYQKGRSDVLTTHIQSLKATYSEGMIHLKCALKNHTSINIDTRLRL